MTEGKHKMGFLNKLSNKITNKIENNVFRSAEKGVDKAMDKDSYKRNEGSGNDCPKCGYMSTDKFCPKCGAEMKPVYSNPSDTTESNPFGADSVPNAGGSSGFNKSAYGIPEGIDFSSMSPETKIQVEEALRLAENEVNNIEDPVARAQARQAIDDIRRQMNGSF